MGGLQKDLNVLRKSGHS